MRSTRYVPAFLKTAGVLCLMMFLTLASACQTPPKKNTRSSSANRSNAAGQDHTAGFSGLDLFSASAERFGTDPRAARPVLVADTVWIVVAGTAGVISLAALVSAIRGARAGRGSSRRRA